MSSSPTLFATTGFIFPRKESRPQAEEIWKAMKDDKRKHIRMLREALSKEAAENKM